MSNYCNSSHAGGSSVPLVERCEPFRFETAPSESYELLTGNFDRLISSINAINIREFGERFLAPSEHFMNWSNPKYSGRTLEASLTSLS